MAEYEYVALCENPTLRRSVRMAAGSSAFGAYYLSGLCAVLGRPTMKLTLISWVVAPFLSPRSLVVFPLFFLVLYSIILVAIKRKWDVEKRMDLLGRGFTHAPPGKTSYGNAHFAEPYEYYDEAQVRPIENAKGIVLGKLGHDMTKVIDLVPSRINSNILVMGLPGGGKTYTFVKTQILMTPKRRRSIIIADTKGSLFVETSGFLQDNGYLTRTLNLKDYLHSDGWDCLSILKGESQIRYCQVFCEAVTSNMHGAPSNRRDIYQSAGSSLLQALVLYVLNSDSYPDHCIRDVHELVHTSLEEMESQIFSRSRMTDEELVALSPFNDFKTASGNLAGNVLTHVATGLQNFNDPNLTKILSTNDIDLTLPGRQPCAYYLQVPDNTKAFQFVQALFFTMLLISLSDYADNKCPGQKLPVGVDFLLDEFAQLGVIPEWSEKMSTLRSRNIAVTMIIQNIPQLRAAYGDPVWKSIVSNCSTVMTLGISEMSETAKYVCDQIGETTIETSSTSQNAHKLTGLNTVDLVTRESVGLGKRPLLTPSELRTLDNNYTVCVIANKPPILAGRTPFTELPQAKKLYDIPVEEQLRFTDERERYIRRIAEKEYIEIFNAERTDYHGPDVKDKSDALFTKPMADTYTQILYYILDDIKVFGKRCGRLAAKHVLHRTDEQETVTVCTDNPYPAYRWGKKKGYYKYLETRREQLTLEWETAHPKAKPQTISIDIPADAEIDGKVRAKQSGEIEELEATFPTSDNRQSMEPDCIEKQIKARKEHEKKNQSTVTFYTANASPSLTRRANAPAAQIPPDRKS